MKTLTIFKNFRRPIDFIFRRGLIDTEYGYSKTKYHMFNSSCKYSIGEDQTDWNKLWGISTKLDPHVDSVRLGWRWFNEHIEICAYCYVNGKRTISKNIEKIKLNRTLITQIEYNKIDKKITVYANLKPLMEIEVTNCDHFWKCGLYFGGNKKAPHKIQIIEI